MDREQVKAYLERIGIDDAELGEPSIELLNRLVEAHQLHIPFEDLEPYRTRRPVSLSLDDLYRKIVIDKRGGYCFELNKLFEALLKACSFEVWPSIGRNVRGTGGGITDELPPIMHRSEIVRLNGKLYGVDVGYGGPLPACSFPLVGGARVENRGQEFAIRRLDAAWWQILYRSRGGSGGGTFSPVVNFMESPAQEGDFELMSHWCCTHPSSPFLNNIICNKRLQNGSVYLRNNTLTRTADGDKTVIELEEGQLSGVLKAEFGIEL